MTNSRTRTQGQTSDQRKPPSDAQQEAKLPQGLRRALDRMKAEMNGRTKAEAEAKKTPHLWTAVDVLRFEGAPLDFLESDSGRVAQEAHNLTHRLFWLTNELCSARLPKEQRERLEASVLTILRGSRDDTPNDRFFSFLTEFREELGRYRRSLAREQPEPWPPEGDALSRLNDWVDRDARRRGLLSLLCAFHADEIARWMGRLYPEDHDKLNTTKLADALRTFAEDDRSGRGRMGGGRRGPSRYRLLAEAIQDTSFKQPWQAIRERWRYLIDTTEGA